MTTPDFIAWKNPTGNIVAALNPRNLTIADEQPVAVLLAEVQGRSQTLRADLEEKDQRFRDMAQRRRDVEAIAADAQQAYYRAFVDATTEGTESPACDFAGIAQRLHGLQMTAKLAQDTLDTITYTILPDLEEAALEAKAEASDNDYLESALLTAFAQIQVLNRTKIAFGEAFGSCALISETVLSMERAAQECQRLAAVARQSLIDFRARRAALKQQRLLNGGVTYAESVHAQVQMKLQKTEM